MRIVCFRWRNVKEAFALIWLKRRVKMFFSEVLVLDLLAWMHQTWFVMTCKKGELVFKGILAACGMKLFLRVAFLNQWTHLNRMFVPYDKTSPFVTLFCYVLTAWPYFFTCREIYNSSDLTYLNLWFFLFSLYSWFSFTS